MLASEKSRRNVSTCIIAFLSFCFIFPAFRAEISLYSTFTDDFFYYLKIASNFNQGFGLSFTPGIFTNGYQPLYQALIVALAFLADIIKVNELVLMKVALGTIFLLSALLLQRKVNPSGVLQYVMFYLGLLLYYLISYTGMESILIVPVLTLLFLEMTRTNISFSTMLFLISLCFFIRIDSVIITVPLACYHFFCDRTYYRNFSSKSLSVLCLFILPVTIYLVLNHFIYSSAFPISGVAKTVTRISGVHPAPFESLYGYRPYNIFNIFTAVMAVFSFPRMSIRLRKYFAVFCATVALFYLQSAVRSDWKLWSWYFYPIPVISFIVASETADISFKKMGSSISMLLSKTAAATAIVPVMLGFMLVFLYTFPLRFLNPAFEGKIDILHIAGFKIKEFEMNNKGVYAMGDRAGVVGYLINSPVIQLEGLVMDKAYLKNFRNSNNLHELLKRYNVDFYIASNAQKLSESTYVVREPIQSNGYSRKIIDTINWKIEQQFKLVQPGMIIKNSYEASETIIFRVPK